MVKKAHEPEEILEAAELYKRHADSLFIETSAGEKFYIDKPHFDIEVMAHALGNQCRYTGHCRRFYSVAEHAVLVSRIMEELKLGDPFEGLLHDGAEAYITDIASPWKSMLPDYKILEAMIDEPMRKHFGLPEAITAGCKRADWIALALEAEVLMQSAGKDWLMPDGTRSDADGVRGKLGIGIACMPPIIASKEFLQRYHALVPKS